MNPVAIYVVLFIMLALIQTWLGGRLYRAARARDPVRYEPEYDWAERVRSSPRSLASEVIKTMRKRSGLVLHVSQYPEVERLRRMLLVALSMLVVLLAAAPLVR